MKEYKPTPEIPTAFAGSILAPSPTARIFNSHVVRRSCGDILDGSTQRTLFTFQMGSFFRPTDEEGHTGMSAQFEGFREAVSAPN